MTKSPDFSLGKHYSPFLQAGVALGVGFILMIFGVMLKGAGIEMSPKFPWMAAGSAIMLFAIFNSIFSLFAQDPIKNWGQSFASFIGLMVIASLLAWAFSGLAIQDAGSFSWIFVVLAIGYLIFMSMVNVMKKIVEFAMREEWQHPRIRNKKRR
ncbi:MAG: hypothetical protein KDC24_15175 [Saprospiraceae bacterium]|nr:hypothetical protein [Saprospiraceae bacterium]